MMLPPMPTDLDLRVLKTALMGEVENLHAQFLPYRDSNLLLVENAKQDWNVLDMRGHLIIRVSSLGGVSVYTLNDEAINYIRAVFYILGVSEPIERDVVNKVILIGGSRSKSSWVKVMGGLGLLAWRSEQKQLPLL
jgi:hypothetical protein